MTRLGLIVNCARRKISDKSLARRMKKLVKQWQRLAVGFNGTQEERKMNRSTPSPLPPNNALTVTTKKPTDPQSNRQKLLNMLSATKKPSSTLPASDCSVSKSTLSSVPSCPQTLTQPSPPSSSSSLATHTPHLSSPDKIGLPNLVDHLKLSQNDSISPEAMPTDSQSSQVNGKNQNSNLIISLPLDRITKQQQHQRQRQQCSEESQLVTSLSLIVKVPLNLIKLPGRHDAPPLLSTPSSPPISSLLVSFRLSLIKALTVETDSSSSKDNHFSMTFSRDSSVLSNGVSSPATPFVEVKKELIGPPTPEVPPTFPPPRAAPPIRLKHSSGVPTYCTIGIDGCMGNDGNWYVWTDPIPSLGDEVTVLPYVYVDGLSGYEQEEVWSSDDRQELTRILNL